MINTHKEFVSEISNFCDKMELISSFEYLKDSNELISRLEELEHRVFLLTLQRMSFDDEYNLSLSYKFIISDEVLNEESAILNSETENIFIISALSDYLNYIKAIGFDFDTIEHVVESDNSSTYCSVQGGFDFVIKRSASYWKQMESYSTD